MPRKTGPSFGKGVSEKEARDLTQQPLDPDGWSSNNFDELYGKDKNPYIGSERDRKKRKSRNVPTILGKKYRKNWVKIFGKKKNENNRRNKRKV